MNNSALLTFAAAMFTILNPIGNVAIFAGMVADRSSAGYEGLLPRLAG